jgi:hypothetical protein
MLQNCLCNKNIVLHFFFIIFIVLSSLMHDSKKTKAKTHIFQNTSSIYELRVRRRKNGERRGYNKHKNTEHGIVSFFVKDLFRVTYSEGER